VDQILEKMATQKDINLNEKNSKKYY